MFKFFVLEEDSMRSHGRAYTAHVQVQDSARRQFNVRGRLAPTPNVFVVA